MSQEIIVICTDITNFVPIKLHKKNHNGWNMSFKKYCYFFQIVTSFVLSRKIIIVVILIFLSWRQFMCPKILKTHMAQVLNQLHY